MRNWILRKGAEKRFLSGHPWVFSNELEVSPKGTEPGEPIALRAADGRFLASGYGNPRSLIAFRMLSRSEEATFNSDWWSQSLERCWRLRCSAGVNKFSYRFVFAENDFLPGLIIDCYRTQEPKAQIYVLQSSTAGMDKCLPEVLSGLQKFVQRANPEGYSWDQTAIVFSNTSSQRRLEGIDVQERRVEKSVDGVNLKNVSGLFEYAADPDKFITLSFNLLEGQKTGFFLDQRENLRSLISLMKTWPLESPIQVLDLCCYVGQWSAQIAEFAKQSGRDCEVTFIDASEDALGWCTKNLQGRATMINAIKGDVVNSLRGSLDRAYNVVICDPPAFIKKKKDVPQGKAAYLKLNKDALRKVAPNGLFVSCSCSGLFTPEEFREMLARAAASRPGTVWLKQGFHSPDHPQRMEFPEGSYLKCLIGSVSSEGAREL